MAKKGNKILTQNQAKKLGLDKVSVITADMIEGYTSIGDWVFYECKSLTSIEIPDRVTCIGYAAFAGCSSLTSVIIPNSVTSIGNNAFYDCTGLASVTIPNSVTSIGIGAFAGCSSLISITVPNSVTSIERYAFRSCSSLTSITIPNGVTSIGDYAFENCCSLTSVTIGNKKYKNRVIKDGKCKAYKGFNADMTCRDFQYEEGETYEFEGEPILCRQGFHACLNLTDVFNYYDGKLGKDIVIHEVELEDISGEKHNDSKVVAKKITIGKRIL